MNSMNPCVERHTAPFVCRLIRLVAAFGLMLSTLASAAPGGGIIEGRVLNAVTGDYLMNARVVVAGQTETLTNSYGEYRIANVPVGMTTVQVIYTGMPTQTVEVEVKSGEVVRRDVAFGAGQPGEVVTLDKFTVTDTRETDGRTIAINEQRYSPNLKNVVSTDEFGAVTEGNVGEFAKWLPGVTVDYNAADARTISVRGLPSSTTPVSVDGNRMASAASSSATRVFELEQVSINNISRVEITKVPTPDSPADALGGAINLVSRSAFERSRPVFNYRAYTSVNSTQFSLNKTPGPKREPTRKVTPGMDFTYIRPVSKNFGFAVNGLYSEQFNPQFRSQRQWASAGLSVANVPPDNPYLARWLVQDAPKFTRRYSIGSTIDWRFAPTDVLSLGIQYNNYDANFGGSNIQWDVGSTPTWGATFTQGRTNVGTNTIGTNYRHKYGNTIMPTLTWRHNGRVWQFEAGAAYSRSENHYRDIGDGFWENVQLTQASQTIRFDEINAVRPGTVTNSGAPFSLANYRIRTARSSQNDAVDTIRSARANVTRGFDGKVPLTFKAGFDVRENRRDIRYPQRTWTFVGADGLANSADDTAGAYVDKTWLGTASPFGLPVVQWPDVYALHDLFVSKPNYFSLNQTGASGSIATEANNSQLIVERVSSLYLRADTRLLSNRLWLVAGARYELTDDSGEGVLSDPTAIYRRNPDGSFVMQGGSRVLITTDPIEQARLIYQARGTHVSKDYGTMHPSFNATYNLGENLIFRAGYARTLGRPNFSFIVPGSRIAEPTTSNPNGTITINNTALKPWLANSFDLAVEYYLKPQGVVSIGVFRKDFSNFFGRLTTEGTAEALESYGLDPVNFLGYDIITMMNVGDARVTGLDLNYSQKLGFLPGLLSGLSVFGNVTSLHLVGANTADFTNFTRRQMNAGIGYSRKKFSMNLKWNYRGRQRGSLQSGTGIGANTYEWTAPRLQVDADLTYAFRPWLGFFAAVRNLTKDNLVFQRYGPATPKYAWGFRDEDYGAQWTFGVRGRF